MFGLFTKKRVSPLAMLGITDLLTLCSHLFLIGASGSGKTSMLRMIMTEVIDRGVACLWGCVKEDEASNAIEVINSTSMRERLLHLVPGKFTFNFLGFELTRYGGTPDTAARLLKRLNDQMMRTSGKQSESFWENLFFQLLHYSIVIGWFALRDKVNVEHIHKLINSTPSSVPESKSDAFKESFCWRIIQVAEQNLKDEGEKRLFEIAVTFLLINQLSLGGKARSSALSQCNALLSPFLLSPMYETVCCEQSTFTPDMPLNGYCTVMDFPILTHGQNGILFQSLITMMVVEAGLRNANPKNITAIVRDEYQMLIADPEFEAMALSVSRSFLLAFVSATQNLPLLQSALGGDGVAEQKMLALFANYNTQLVLANRCSVTNAHFSKAFGEHREQFISVNEKDINEHQEVHWTQWMLGGESYLFSTSEQMAPRIPTEQFLSLRRGGTANNYMIDAFLSQGGRTYDGGRPFTQVTFSQR